ncbi:hypothetical protein [Dielma fastidiosa]|uniref:hypothetical protein n=1 Tax=Dielma fastidiosa TaxID=1034346 RepID=UPI003567D3D2
MLNWQIYPTESPIACFFHCVIATLCVMLILHWRLIIKKSSRLMIDEMMDNHIKIKMSMTIFRVITPCLYFLGVVLEALSYHMRNVWEHAYPFMQLFKLGFLCFYIVDLSTIAYFMIFLSVIKHNSEKEKNL